MAKQSSPVSFYSPQLKYVGLVLLGIALALFIVQWVLTGLPNFRLSYLSAIALVFIFFSKEKYNDERIIQLKYQALAVGITVAILISMLIGWYINQINGYQATSDRWFVLSAFEYLTITLLLSLGYFHYLKRSA